MEAALTSFSSLVLNQAWYLAIKPGGFASAQTKEWQGLPMYQTNNGL